MNNGSTPSRKVFLSSTTSDLVDYRVVAERVIRELNDEFSGEFLLNPSSMNTKTQTGERETAVEASRSYVRDADWIVLIVAWKYGFMPKPSSAAAKQSWEPCSVTEWEYREATTVAQPAKLCFVFMAGEQTDGELFVYRALEASRERINLADFKGLEGLAATKKLAEFKKHLRGGKNNLGQPFELFKNIEHFEQRLQKTLRNRIKEELRKLKGVDLGPVLMILGLLTPTRTFIETVTTLAKVKTLHDRLHKIRQFGIRMWREVTLPQWKSSGVVDDVI
ncbi:MAG: DUF4062 domain-containing protein, partial [Nevskia sp.]|nr:DUF4062 domain-containing protein [Nevskia sp.]